MPVHTRQQEPVQLEVVPTIAIKVESLHVHIFDAPYEVDYYLTIGILSRKPQAVPGYCNFVIVKQSARRGRCPRRNEEETLMTNNRLTRTASVQ